MSIQIYVIEEGRLNYCRLLTTRRVTRGKAKTKDSLNLLRIHRRLRIPHDTYVLPHRRQAAYRQAVCAHDTCSRKA